MLESAAFDREILQSQLDPLPVTEDDRDGQHIDIAPIAVAMLDQHLAGPLKAPDVPVVA